jgi:surfeit locus 1 family protein
MKHKWPVLPTILATLAVLTMLGLAYWQMQRKDQKEALLVRYNTAASQPPVAYPAVPLAKDMPLFRQSSVNCLKVISWRAISGQSIKGEAGYAHLAACQTGGGEGPGATVALGWSPRPDNPNWAGGFVSGIIAPDGKQLIKLVVSDLPANAVPGVSLLAKPSPANIPNNHLIYAIQWLIFAAAAAIIYVLAVRKKWREQSSLPSEDLQKRGK